MPDRQPVHIIDTGVANIASVRAAWKRLGAEAVLTTDRDTVRNAELVVLPGVGSFAAGIERIDSAGLREPLLDRIAAGRPLLAICLGLQMLCAGSDESPGVKGLGILPGTVRRFRGDVLVPQLGWNRVTPRDPGAFTVGHAYFANSYRLAEPPEGWEVALTDYAGPFVSMARRGRVFACQFHPELSGAWGLGVMQAWLRTARSGDAASLTRRIIPCLDVRDGRVVKGVRFQGLRDAGDPAELAARYAADGADELVILDVSATTEDRRTAIRTIEAVRAVINIALTVGGGVRTVEDAATLLSAGADKVAVNTAAVRTPGVITELADRFGSQCTVVALDAARREDGPGWQVVTRSGTQREPLDAVAWAAEVAALGAGEILLTSWDRDGTGLGYDLALLEAVTRAARVPVIASGGAKTIDHLLDAFGAGAHAVLAASIFHDGERSVRDVKAALAGRGVNVRFGGDHA